MPPDPIRLISVLVVVTFEDSKYGFGEKFAPCRVGAREEFWFVIIGEFMGWMVFIWDPRED